MSEKLKILDRTFGLELEFGNVKKEEVDLPAGYGWSPDERSIVNSNSKKATPTGDFGGELNTRPLKPSLSDVREVKSVIRKCLNVDGVLMWNTGFDGHIYIGDLELDDLKKIFALGFYVSPLLNKMFKLGEWFNVPHLVPTPTFEFLDKVNEAQSIDALRNVFANSSNVGHFRFQINLMSFYKTGTLEFRIFNCSENFRDTLETIKFMYSFLDYALTKKIEDFQAIETEEDFVREFNITREFADKTPPLIFAESHHEATRNISKGFSPSRKIISAIINDTAEKLIIVNPFYYQTELSLYKAKHLTVYNNSEFNNVVYLISKGELTIDYENHFEILGEYKDGTRETELSLFFVFARIQKYDVNTEYGINEYLSYTSKIEESLEKMKPNSEEIITLLATAKYKVGTLKDAIQQANMEKADVVFQQEYNSKANSALTALKKHTSYSLEFKRAEMRYEKVKSSLKNSTKLLIVSKNDFLPYEKIARDLDVTLYSNQKSYLGVRQVMDETLNICITTPEDDFEIKKKTKITIHEVKPNLFSALQVKFVKKVAKFTQPKICYTVNSGDIVLGAFGFDYSKDKGYSLWLLSDFCTNNNVPMLSKFILYVIKSREVKKMIERKLVNRVSKGYTKVYTTMPVSMKYRGAFKKVGGDGKVLVYDFAFGSVRHLSEAKQEYFKRVNK